MIFRSSPGGERTKALANVKSIMGGLLSFKPYYGAFPCDATRGELAKEEFINLPTSNSSNAYLTQLLVAESIDNPAPFSVPGTKFTKNNRWSKNDIATGTNGFAYLMAADGALLSDTKSFTPHILAEIVTIGTEPVFDAQVLGGKFVFGRVAESSEARDLDENGHVFSTDGGNLFQTGPYSIFGKNTPVLKYPLGL